MNSADSTAPEGGAATAQGGPRPAAAGEVFWAFLIQGLTAFGGPVAHLAYFRREFVERRKWVSDAAFADLLALCQFLPGPASSQLGMALGLRRAGPAGMLAALVGFALPATAAMIALAYLAPRVSGSWGEGWLHGLKVAAAAVVLNALVQMARSLAAGPVRAGMAIGAGVGLMIVDGAMAQVLALSAGAVFGLALLREAPGAPDAGPTPRSVSPRAAAVCFALFALLLAALPLLAQVLASPSLALGSVFYRTGALVFGGGHVVLPLLEAEVVGRGWLDGDAFLAGYGAAQALPGPLFSFAGFVGAAQRFAPGGWLGGLVAVGAIFLPSVLLLPAALPFWDRLKSLSAARGAAAGLNAVVVGLLAAALWDPMLTSTIVRPSDWALVAAAYVFLAVAKAPPWLVVLGFAAATGFMTP